MIIFVLELFDILFHLVPNDGWDFTVLVHVFGQSASANSFTTFNPNIYQHSILPVQLHQIVPNFGNRLYGLAVIYFPG